MTTVLVPVATEAAIDAVMGEAAAGTIAAGAAVAAPAAIVAAGAAVDYALLRNKAWDGFWEGVGANVNNFYHSVTHFLFGGGGVSIQTVHDMVQLALHTSNRLSRELFTEASAAAHAGVHVLAHAVDALRAADRAIVNEVHRVEGAVISAELSAVHTAERYADAGLRRLLDDVRGIEAGLVTLLEAWAIDNIAHPLLTELGKVEARIASVVDALPHLIDTRIDARVGAKLAALAGTVAGVSAIVDTLVAEAEACGEPMCDYVGPKSDWGKLLKAFGPEAIFAMLAAIAAQHPKAVEDAAEGLADALGPVLATWVEQWALGSGGVFPKQPGEVSGGLGKLPLIP